MRRLFGLRDLVHDAIEKTTDLVEETHEAAAKKPIAVLSQLEPIGSVARGVDEVRGATAKLVFDSVRLTNRSVQRVSDVGLKLGAKAVAVARELGLELKPHALAAPLTHPVATDVTERAESALNAVMGDFLAARANGLAIEMRLRADGRDLPIEGAALSAALEGASPKLCLFLHGLGCSDSVWSGGDERGARTSFGELLARDLGYTCLTVRYNTGLHISENGRTLARLLDALMEAYPVALEEVALVGHSMGGLVARSAAHYARALDAQWIAKLTHVLCIGSPHFGAPLERMGNLVASLLRSFDLAGTQVPAKLINARSAGVKDLRFGSILDEDWRDGDPDAFLTDTSRHAAFVDGVTYGYVAAHAQPDAKGPFTELLGDLLVQLPSASGQHRDPTRHLPFHMGHVIAGVNHVALTTHPAVYAQLKRFLLECGRA